MLNTKQKILKKFSEEFYSICEPLDIDSCREIDDEVESFLSKALDEVEKETKASMMVSLYEARASFTLPISAKRSEKIENVFNYQIISSVIAKMYDYHNVDGDLVKEKIRELSLEDQLE